MPADDRQPALDSLLLVVVGAHLRAEIEDRPLAYELCKTISECAQNLRAEHAISGGVLIGPIVCTDLWYLNNPELLARPTISVGDPSINAATAYLASHLPTAFVIEGSYRVHLDPEFAESPPRSCLWGADAAANAAAVKLFVERYLQRFVLATADA